MAHAPRPGLPRSVQRTRSRDIGVILWRRTGAGLAGRLVGRPRGRLSTRAVRGTAARVTGGLIGRRVARFSGSATGRPGGGRLVIIIAAVARGSDARLWCCLVAVRDSKRGCVRHACGLPILCVTAHLSVVPGTSGRLGDGCGWRGAIWPDVRHRVPSVGRARAVRLRLRPGSVDFERVGLLRVVQLHPIIGLRTLPRLERIEPDIERLPSPRQRTTIQPIRTRRHHDDRDRRPYQDRQRRGRHDHPTRDRIDAGTDRRRPCRPSRPGRPSRPTRNETS